MAISITKKKEVVPEKNSASAQVLAGLKKAHGDGIGGSGMLYAPPGRIPTGIFPLDLAIGGGLPENKATVLWGPPSSGKSAVAYKTIGSCQRIMKDKRAVLIDREDAYDKVWAARLGVDVNKLIVIKPSNAEQCVDAAEGMIHAEDVGILVLDSLATMQPQKWIEAEAGTAPVGGNTQMINMLYTKVNVGLTQRGWAKNPVLFVAINQIRYKVGKMFGDPETMPGGMGPQHWSSLTLRFYGKKIKPEKSDLPTHLEVTGTVRKYKIEIVGTSFAYDMALSDHDGYGPGDIQGTWKTVAHRLQASGDMVKKGKDWHCMGVEAHTLEMLEERYRNDPEWQLALQQQVFQSAKIIEAQK